MASELFLLSQTWKEEKNTENSLSVQFEFYLRDKMSTTNSLYLLKILDATDIR